MHILEINIILSLAVHNFFKLAMVIQKRKGIYISSLLIWKNEECGTDPTNHQGLTSTHFKIMSGKAMEIQDTTLKLPYTPAYLEPLKTERLT